MVRILSLFFQIAGVSAGVFLGLSLKNGGPAPALAAETAAAQAAEGEQKPAKNDKNRDKKKKKNAKKGGKDKGKDAGSGNHAFLKFSRQFIVPVAHTDGVNALVMLDINLEVSQEISETAYAHEPKLRDALLSTLLELSTEGAFNDRFTESDNMDAIRERLLASAQSILQDDVHKVLILSIARQNF